ncbi:MAG: hypothetical protein FWF11_04515 [Coriobacteriia bacterium]|nr:hypothetical protein [Coriobacteriia bacterium]
MSSSRGIDRQRWAELTIFEQMGNTGSEVGRAIKAQRSGKIARRDSAIERAIDLFDATAAVWAAQKSPRTKEVLRAKEQFLNLFYGEANDADAESLERYFTQFALAARRV